MNMSVDRDSKSGDRAHVHRDKCEWKIEFDIKLNIAAQLLDPATLSLVPGSGKAKNNR
jgi:hypothetical protein